MNLFIILGVMFDGTNNQMMGEWIRRQSSWVSSLNEEQRLQTSRAAVKSLFACYSFWGMK